MKLIVLFIALPIFGFSQQHLDLSAEEKEQIKKDIIKGYEKHTEALLNLDYKEVMKYYADVDDHVIFGDGYYWGDYKTIDNVWKRLTNSVRQNLTTELKNHKVYVFSENATLHLFEYYNERIEANGDTTKVQGCFSHGMQKFPDGWKIVTTHVSHNYLACYDPRVKQSK